MDCAPRADTITLERWRETREQAQDVEVVRPHYPLRDGRARSHTLLLRLDSGRDDV